MVGLQRVKKKNTQLHLLPLVSSQFKRRIKIKFSGTGEMDLEEKALVNKPDDLSIDSL